MFCFDGLAFGGESLMAKRKTVARLEEDLRVLRQSRVVDAVTAISNRFIAWTGMVVIAYFAYKSIEVLAGRNTTADIGLKLLGDIKISEAVAWIFGVGGIGYGVSQRKLRRDSIARLAPRAKELEEARDPHRSSSGLTTRGTTPAEEPQ